MEKVMELVLDFTGAQRGFVLLHEEGQARGRFSTHCAASHNFEADELDSDTFRGSRTIVNHVITSGRSELSCDAISEDRYATSSSIQKSGIRAVMCVPLTNQDQRMGVIYVDTMAGAAPFSAETLETLTAFANLAGMAISNARLIQNLRKEMMTNLVMKNYQWAILHSVQSGIVAVDPQFRLTTVNRAAQEILGLDGSARGQSLIEVLPEATPLHNVIGQILRQEQSLIRDSVEIQGPEGDLHLQVSVTPLREPGAKSPGATLILTDQTREIESQRERTHIRDLFGRVVSRDVMEELLREPDWGQAGARRTVTILFVDINDFSTRCEQMKPGRIIEMLNSYFGTVNSVIFRHRGMIKQFVGDEILVLFGAPKPSDDHAVSAVRTALEIVETLARQRATDQGGFYDVKIGIHTGEVVVGHVGSEERFEYAAVGDAVNLASRIMGLNRELGTSILISESTRAEVAHVLPNVTMRDQGEHTVKGRSRPEAVYEVVTRSASSSNASQ